MSASGVVARGRAAAERLMLDGCTVKRKTGTVTNSNATVTDTFSTLYAGACKVQSLAALDARDPEAGGRTQIVVRLQVHVPMSVTGIQVGDVVTVTAAVMDADLVGQQYRVRSLSSKTFATARRLEVEDRQA